MASNNDENEEPNSVPSSGPPPFIIYDDDDHMVDGVESCSKSIIGKIFTQKPIHMNSLQNALAGIWCNPKGFRIEEVVVKTFQFFFEKEDDVERILKGSPWLIRNLWLILKTWCRNQKVEEVDFTKVHVRVQLWGLPAHCRTLKMGQKIGACLGRVGEVDIFENRERGSFIKVLVDIDVTKPLLSGIPMASKKDGISLVSFQYERLPQFCYNCGRIGHDEDMCIDDKSTGTEEEEESKTFGPWMRASHFGRKVNSQS
ncbi:Zinc finger, CCHC-type [Sesbania bispinosa]|nr:Zinc finger, CCHC-type [Sesbania bispinosa]